MSDEPMHVDITLTQGDHVQVHQLVIDPADGGWGTLDTENEFTETEPCEENDWRRTFQHELTGRLDLTLTLKKARYREADR